MNRVKLKSAALAVVLTVLLGTGMAWASVEIYVSYGPGLFLVTPSVAGAVCVLIFNRKGDRRCGESVLVSLIAGFCTLLGFLAFGLEGLICLAMAAPFIIPLFILGGLLGFLLSRVVRKRLAAEVAAVLLTACVPLLLGFESKSGNPGHPQKVQTSVLIEAGAAAVWKEVIAFSEIPQPTELLFRMGIAYPTDAHIEGVGVGAIRTCNFSTGAFVEPITHWEENRRLAFDVIEQPVPMIEISPYTGIHPPHLDWAIRSERGEFLIQELGDGRVELTGTTWYQIRMEPVSYWGWLTDKMIEMIHKRVLNHIKHTVEAAPHSADQ